MLRSSSVKRPLTLLAAQNDVLHRPAVDDPPPRSAVDGVLWITRRTGLLGTTRGPIGGR